MWAAVTEGYSSLFPWTEMVTTLKTWPLRKTFVYYMSLQNLSWWETTFLNERVERRDYDNIKPRLFSISPSFVISHFNDVKMSVIMSPITRLTIVYSTVFSGADQRKHQSSASLAFVRGIHGWPGNSPHKGPVTRKFFSIWWRHHVLWGAKLIKVYKFVA